MGNARTINPGLTNQELIQLLEQYRVRVNAAKARHTVKVDGVDVPITTDAAWLAVLAKQDIISSIQAATDEATRLLAEQSRQEQETINF